MKQKQEDEEKDATTEEKATQRGKTGKEKNGFPVLFEEGRYQPPQKEQWAEHLSTAKTKLAEAGKGEERAEQEHSETNSKGTNY